MSAFAIVFDPPIEPAKASATDDWIARFDWDDMRAIDLSAREIDLLLYVDDKVFGYYPDTIGGVLGSLMAGLHAVQSVDDGEQVDFAVQGYTVLCAQKVDGALQFYSPANSYEGAALKPLNRRLLVGAPIATGDIESVLRGAIAAVGQTIAHERDKRGR